MIDSVLQAPYSLEEFDLEVKVVHLRGRSRNIWKVFLTPKISVIIPKQIYETKIKPFLDNPNSINWDFKYFTFTDPVASGESR